MYPSANFNLNYSKVWEHAHNCTTLVRPFLTYALAPVCAYGAYKFLSYLVPGPHHQRKLNLKDRTVIITGASSGLGRALAFEFYSKGAKVILTARSIDKLEELCNDLEKCGRANNWNNLHQPVFRFLDLAALARMEDVDNYINELRSLAIDGKTIDVLVNNAGVSNRGSGLETSLDVQRKVMEVNFFGSTLLTKTLLDAIPDDGAILVINSLQGRVALPYRSAYSASKHASQAFFDSLRGEERFNLQILVTNLGYVNTGFGSRALGVDGQPVGYADENQAKGMSADECARRLVSALVERRTELVLAKTLHWLTVYLRIFTPNLLWWALERRAKAELKKVAAEMKKKET